VNWMDQITDELDWREARQREFHGKCDDEHGAFSRWLLEQFDNREKTAHLLRSFEFTL
jgi:hypothetical protein